MTQEKKELSLKDLCSRLLYGVKVIRYIERNNQVEQLIPEMDLSLSLFELYTSNQEFIIKPYLRPMSSMTEDEREEFNHLYYDAPVVRDRGNAYRDTNVLEWMHIDWYNKHHFDYRGLIPKGLAIEAPEGMYN